MSEERYYVREQRGDWHPTSTARNRGAVNGLAILLNKEYEEWLLQPSA